MKTQPKKLIVLLAIGAVLLLPLPAMALAVSPADYTGSRSTPAASGVVAYDGWAAADGGLKISWAVTQVGVNFNYSYTIANADGSTPSTPDVSHLILEVSGNFTEADIFNANAEVVGPQTFTADPLSPNNTNPGGNGGNPNLPVDIFGVKLDDGLTTYTFTSTRLPMWGDFYVKDGKHSNIVATAWNTGIGTDPTVLTTDFTNWIPVPNSAVPIPPTALLLGSGLLGLGVWGWRRRRS